jgi:eukaryotic-like serine/threonine-protein kinase
LDGVEWQRVKELFSSALDRVAGEREVFLAEACAGNQELLEQVRSLLREHERLAEVQPSIAEPSLSQLSSTDSMSGRRLGAYRILRRVGQGGMATVYLAVRADNQYRKTVAIKMVPAGVDNEALIRRFRNERQTLAALDHPHIVKLVDAGTTDDGLPFLVMDYVEGTRLDRYCDHHKLTINERLQLFRKVCDAVSYAHQRLIIHRDLKPSNILVTAEGAPKLLDFGIAKLMIPEAAATLVLTGTGQRLMTPEYASPEQVRGEPLTNATDVYSLGVVLYELLTGHRPVRVKSRSPMDMERAICEEEPSKPSVVVTRSVEQQREDGTAKTSTPEEISRLRTSDPKTLSHQLHGDLDAILITALRKEPQRRYTSVHEFSEDIGRHLESLPIKARPGTAGYRLTKFFRRHREAMVVSLFAIVVAMTIGVRAVYERLHAVKPLTDTDTIVLADFANNTGDPAFDEALKTGLAVSLRQSPFLNVLSDSKVAGTLKLMTRPVSTVLTADLAHEVCQRTSSKGYITGSIVSLGREYVVALKALNCRSGDTIAQEQATAASKEKVLDALGDAASRLRGELGESLTTIQKYDVPLAEATTSSLDALKAYSLGQRALSEKGPATALPYYQEAIHLDANFAAAYEQAGYGYYGLGELGRAVEYFTKAFQLSGHTSELERLGIAGGYYLNVTGELDKAAQTFEEELQLHPREGAVLINLANVYSAQGRWAQAEGAYRKALEIAPENSIPYANLANTLLALQHFEGAMEIIRQAQAKNLDDLLFHNALYAIAFIRHDDAALKDDEQWFVGKPEEHFGLSLAADTEGYIGHLRAARQLTERSVEAAIRADNKESAAIWLQNAALREAAFGNNIEASRTAARGLQLYSKSQGVSVEASLAFAFAHNRERAESLMREINEQFPLDTQTQSVWLPTIRAALAISAKQPSRAIGELRRVSPLELGQIEFVNNLSCLYSTYTRGTAYLMEGAGQEAAAEFQKILDHSGIVWNCWTGALAHLGLARASTLEASNSTGSNAEAAKARARSAYRDFLTLWKNADPDIPVLAAAKRGYSKLQ